MRADVRKERARKATGPEVGRVRLHDLDDLDRRTRSYQRVQQTRDAVLSDLGGEAGLSTLERIAVDSTAMMAAMLTDIGARWLGGEKVEVQEFATLQNVFNRTAASVGWNRRSRNITPNLGFMDGEMAASDADDEMEAAE